MGAVWDIALWSHWRADLRGSQMPKARNKRRLNRRRRNASSNKPLTGSQPNRHPSEHQQRGPWRHRLLNWLVTANKAALAAIGAGVLGAITAAVIGLPHLLADRVLGSPPPLTVAGGPASGTAAAADPCSLSGYFVVPGTLHPRGTVSTNQLAALLNNAADADSSSGTYVLQANPGQTVVITAIHTIVIRRVPATRATEIEADSMCAGAAPVIYYVSINLDATNLTPKVQIGDPARAGKMTNVHGLQTIVTNENPIVIDFDATTKKYDVTWKLLIDYTVNGQSRTAWIQNGSQPFHTVAGRRDDTGLTFDFDFTSNSWTIHNGSPDQQ